VKEANMTIKLFVIAMITLIGCAETRGAQEKNASQSAQAPKKISPEVWKKAQESGTVRVIVDLNVPGWTSKKLSQQGDLAQRQMIANAQQLVRTDLTKTRHKINRQFEIVPGLALEVGPDGLAALERSRHVVRVYEDAGLSPSPESIEIKKAPGTSK
jgi:hypothetical protein